MLLGTKRRGWDGGGMVVVVVVGGGADFEEDRFKSSVSAEKPDRLRDLGPHRGQWIVDQ